MRIHYALSIQPDDTSLGNRLLLCILPLPDIPHCKPVLQRDSNIDDDTTKLVCCEHMK